MWFAGLAGDEAWDLLTVQLLKKDAASRHMRTPAVKLGSCCLFRHPPASVTSTAS